MLETGTISIADLDRAVAALDPAGAYRQVSYNLTERNTLSADPPWWVFMPYGAWSPNPSPPDPSPFEGAILRVIPAQGDECFIDISHLGASAVNFFADPKASKQVATALAAFVNALPASATPVIRYIVGNPSAVDPQSDGLVQALFQSGAVKHPNAWFYFGYYAPSFQLSAGRDRVGAIWERAVKRIEAVSPDLRGAVEPIEDRMTGWLDRFVEAVSISPVSWNHAKIFAVNGTDLVTGGANYWEEYTTGNPWLFDMAMTIEGDAAVDAHRFADYVWRYLGNIPSTDASSQSLGGQFGTSELKPAKAPLYSGSPQNEGAVAALTVARNGLWPSADDGVPAQIFDAARDFVLNVVYAVAATYLSSQSDVAAVLAGRLSDDDPEVRALWADLGVVPAAWATRYARNYAIRNAQKTVRLDQQKLVLDDLVADSAEYRDLVAEINAVAKWDGFLWPYDTLRALGQALATIRAGGGDPTSAIEIVASYLHPAEGGYNDAVSAADFKGRLVAAMTAMSEAGELDVPPAAIAPLVDAAVVYKRVSLSESDHPNHCKVAVVDDAVCYVGSDNAYPSWNQEFGVWIDDPVSVAAFLSDYWAGLWSFAQLGP